MHSVNTINQKWTLKGSTCSLDPPLPIPEDAIHLWSTVFTLGSFFHLEVLSSGAGQFSALLGHFRH